MKTVDLSSDTFVGPPKTTAVYTVYRQTFERTTIDYVAYASVLGDLPKLFQLFLLRKAGYQGAVIENGRGDLDLELKSKLMVRLVISTGHCFLSLLPTLKP